MRRADRRLHSSQDFATPPSNSVDEGSLDELIAHCMVLSGFTTADMPSGPARSSSEVLSHGRSSDLSMSEKLPSPKRELRIT